MRKCLTDEPGAALAEHIGGSKVTKVYQQSVNSGLLEAQISTRRKEIIRWLAPVASDVEYFSNDLASAKALRHPKTCVWVLDKPELTQLCDTSHGSAKSLLWIYANPGAGKTVLSSFLIDHFESAELDPTKGNVFYFFCKNTDVDKNTPTVVVRSLLYQLYKSIKNLKASQSLNHDLGVALDKSGQQRAVNFTLLWQLFSTHVMSSAPATIILDALDECQDPSQLIDGLKELSTLRSIKVIVTSRKDLHLHNEFNNVPTIEIVPEDINADITAFVEAKVEASPQLSHPLVRDSVITKLCNDHDGMFLWVYLVLKELKSCISIAKVQDALAKLPTGLDGIYKSILYRLQTTLTSSSLDLCSKVLTWVVSAVVGSNLGLYQRYNGLTYLQRPLGIHEIKHALTLHYDMDGDTLLTDDRSFPYSEKDVELICGSLVTIRKGTLQVIHLTVKEFLRSPQETSGPTSPSLLVKPERGSLQLTLVCLRCIAGYAEPLVDLASKVPQIDWVIDSGALERSQARAPLLGYAMFSWLVHLIDCELDDLLKITPTFQKTFSSPATFSWVETCIASQPNSLLRLGVGIGEVRDWLNDSSQGFQLQQDESSGKFLASWCIAMSRIFEEYGAVLVRRPWQIYLIDLYDIFGVDPNLRKLWQKYGETPVRETGLQLDGYRPSRSHQEKPKPHLQLQKSIQFGHSGYGLGFLVHNEAQNLYIWGENLIDRESHCIYVQHDKTGQRLPPAEDLSLNRGPTWELVGVNLSPNGGYLVLFYSQKIGFPGDRGLTVAWRIKKDISFKRRMNCEPWARVIFSATSEFRLFYRAIKFKDEHCCFTPIGTLDLLTATRRALPDSVTKWLGRCSGLFYSYSGQYLLASGVYDPSENKYIPAKRIDLSEPSNFVDFSWEDERRDMADMSPSGRYLVLSGRRLVLGTSHSAEKILYLYDTNSSETVNLPLPEPLDYVEGKFHFSRDETRLIIFLSCRFTLAVMIWDCLVTTPKLTSYAKLDTDGLIMPHWIYVHEAATSAVIVTRTRYIQQVELGDKIGFLDASNSIDPYPHRLSTISRDCSHWALVSYGQKGGKVQIMDLTSPNTPARLFGLDWSQSDIPEPIDEGTGFPIGISPDLSILIVYAEVFDLTCTTNGKGPFENLTLTPFTMESVPALLRHYRRPTRYSNLDCRISPCNTYVIYVERGDQWGDSSRDPSHSSAIFLFRIDIQRRTSAQLELMLPEGLVSSYARFHPSLPLMAISYGIHTTTELKNTFETPPDLCLAIFNLSSLTMKMLTVGEGQVVEAMKE